jgi:hypothetical protein
MVYRDYLFSSYDNVNDFCRLLLGGFFLVVIMRGEIAVLDFKGQPVASNVAMSVLNEVMQRRDAGDFFSVHGPNARVTHQLVLFVDV